jgi:hypothetical protein
MSPYSVDASITGTVRRGKVAPTMQSSCDLIAVSPGEPPWGPLVVTR